MLQKFCARRREPDKRKKKRRTDLFWIVSAVTLARMSKGKGADVELQPMGGKEDDLANMPGIDQLEVFQCKRLWRKLRSVRAQHARQSLVIACHARLHVCHADLVFSTRAE